MSVTSNIISKVSKIKTDVELIRDKLSSLGITSATDKLSTMATKIQSISDYTKNTTISNSVIGTYNTSSGSGVIFTKPKAGYYSSNTLLNTIVPNLEARNIREGVLVGGVVGTYSPPPPSAYLVYRNTYKSEYTNPTPADMGLPITKGFTGKSLYILNGDGTQGICLVRDGTIKMTAGDYIMANPYMSGYNSYAINISNKSSITTTSYSIKIYDENSSYTWFDHPTRYGNDRFSKLDLEVDFSSGIVKLKSGCYYMGVQTGGGGGYRGLSIISI